MESLDNLFHYLFFLFTVGVDTHVPWHVAYGGQRPACEIWFPPCNMCCSRTELGYSGLEEVLLPTEPS